jgi:hypothetical protein
MTNKELEMVIEIKEAELAGLKAKLEGCEDQNGEPEKEVKRPARGKKAAKAKPEPEVEEEETEEDADDYERMTSTALYKLCCERGISSKCKKRDKKTLIAVLKENDAAQDAEDDWEDEEEQETDPYAGKTAKELYKMCKDRGLTAVPKKSADVYAKILKKADAEAAKKTNTKAQVEEDEDDEDDWEI